MYELVWGRAWHVLKKTMCSEKTPPLMAKLSALRITPRSFDHATPASFYCNEIYFRSLRAMRAKLVASVAVPEAVEEDGCYRWSSYSSTLKLYISSR